MLTSSHIDHTRKGLKKKGHRTLWVVSGLQDEAMKRYSMTLVHGGQKCILVTYLLDGSNLPSASRILTPLSRLESRKKSNDPTQAETYQSTERPPELPSSVMERSERIKCVIEELAIELGIVDVEILLSNILEVFGRNVEAEQPSAECPLLTRCVVFDPTLFEHRLTSCDKSAIGSVNPAGTHIPSSLSLQERETTKTMGEIQSYYDSYHMPVDPPESASGISRSCKFSTLANALPVVGSRDQFGNGVRQLQSQSACVTSPAVSNYSDYRRDAEPTISYDGVIHHSSFNCPSDTYLQFPTTQSACESSIPVGQGSDGSMLYVDHASQLYDAPPHALSQVSAVSSGKDSSLPDYINHLGYPDDSDAYRQVPTLS